MKGGQMIRLILKSISTENVFHSSVSIENIVLKSHEFNTRIEFNATQKSSVFNGNFWITEYKGYIMGIENLNDNSTNYKLEAERDSKMGWCKPSIENIYLIGDKLKIDLVLQELTEDELNAERLNSKKSVIPFVRRVNNENALSINLFSTIAVYEHVKEFMEDQL
jgi:hypothetical protein